MVLRVLGMSSHSVIVGCLDSFQLMNCFMHVFTDLFNVVPVLNPLGNRDSAHKRQTRRKNSDSNGFLHHFPLLFITARENISLPSHGKQVHSANLPAGSNQDDSLSSGKNRVGLGAQFSAGGSRIPARNRSIRIRDVIDHPRILSLDGGVSMPVRGVSL